MPDLLPLSPEEVDALELDWGVEDPDSLVQRLFKTVRDRERQRDEAVASIDDDSPGTPLGRLEAMADWAEAHCGHNPTSSRGFESAIIKHVERLRHQLAECAKMLRRGQKACERQGWEKGESTEAWYHAAGNLAAQIEIAQNAAREREPEVNEYSPGKWCATLPVSTDFRGYVRAGYGDSEATAIADLKQILEKDKIAREKEPHA